MHLALIYSQKIVFEGMRTRLSSDNAELGRRQATPTALQFRFHSFNVEHSESRPYNKLHKSIRKVEVIF
jgi:hypothetical protein